MIFSKRVRHEQWYALLPRRYAGDTLGTMGKALRLKKHGSSANPDLRLSWSKAESGLRELIKNDRYLNEKEKDHYADYLESEEAPQYEIDAQRKMARRRFIDASRDLSPADKRDTLALRLSDFIRDLDGYEKDLLENVERTDLADVTAEQMEQHLGDLATVQHLLDFLALGTGKDRRCLQPQQCVAVFAGAYGAVSSPLCLSRGRCCIYRRRQV